MERKPRNSTATAIFLLSAAVVSLRCGSHTNLDGPDGDAGAAEEWGPSVVDVAPGGWADSGTPWMPPPEHNPCAGAGFSYVDLLASEDALYLSWAWTSVRVDPGLGYHVLAVNSAVSANRGAGWTEVHHARDPLDAFPDQVCVARLAGCPAGQLVVRVWESEGIHAPLANLDESGLHLWPDSLWDISDPYFVSDSLAYAVWGGTDSKVLRFDGSDWIPVVEVLPYDLPYQLVSKIWADERDLFVAGERGTILSLDDTGWRNHALGTTRPISALWGLAGDDVWAADDGGALFHWDGVRWSVQDWPNLASEEAEPCDEPQSIIGIWGSGDTVYFHTVREILAWRGGEWDVLGYWPGTRAAEGRCDGGVAVLALAGLSATTVFFAAAELEPEDEVGDTTVYTRTCLNRPFVLFWDGSTFHWI